MYTQVLKGTPSALSPIYDMQTMLWVDYCMGGSDTPWNQDHEEFCSRLDCLEVFAQISLAYFIFSSGAADFDSRNMFGCTIGSSHFSTQITNNFLDWPVVLCYEVYFSFTSTVSHSSGSAELNVVIITNQSMKIYSLSNFWGVFLGFLLKAPDDVLTFR